jgi:hypothetical protein
LPQFLDLNIFLSIEGCLSKLVSFWEEILAKLLCDVDDGACWSKTWEYVEYGLLSHFITNLL